MYSSLIELVTSYLRRVSEELQVINTTIDQYKTGTCQMTFIRIYMICESAVQPKSYSRWRFILFYLHANDLSEMICCFNENHSDIYQYLIQKFVLLTNLTCKL